MEKLKLIFKKLIPEKLILIYHFAVATMAAFFFGFPSREMIVIGVTGTKGKTTSCNFIWSVLSAAGYKTGLTSSANIRIGEKEILNPSHMTMPGRFILRQILSQMRKEGCQFCVLETTSEGLKQWRHKGIVYDICVFTNLSPEHLLSHGGSFEKYKKTKGRIFASLSRSSHKTFQGKKVPKSIVANSDSKHSHYFLNFKADRKLTFGLKEGADYRAENLESSSKGVRFSVNKIQYSLSLLGAFNVYNALPAIVIASLFDIPKQIVQKGLKDLSLVPGRMEKIKEGQDFTVLVDYAHEQMSMKSALKTVKELKSKDSNTIVLLGAEGGGRDKSKRPLMGQIAGENSDFVVVSNVDPYQEDPVQILEDIALAAEKKGKIRNKDLFVIEDRREGIRKALSLAQKGDFVLITGKGAEQTMIIKGKRYPWDDRKIVREELKSILK